MAELETKFIEGLTKIRELLEEILEVNKLMNSKLELLNQKLDVLSEISKRIDRLNYLMATKGVGASQKDQKIDMDRLRLKVYRLLRELGKINKADLQRILQVNKETLEEVLKELKERGNISEENGAIVFKVTSQRETRRRGSKDKVKSAFDVQ